VRADSRTITTLAPDANLGRDGKSDKDTLRINDNQGEIGASLDRIITIIVDDLITTEREHNIKPRDLPFFYQKQVAQNRKGGRYDETRGIVSEG